MFTMLIRKNTKAFKTIHEIVTACQARADRENLIRLFVTKAGQSVADRIPVEGIQGGSAFFYEMNYQTILNSLNSSNHQLNVSDTIPGVYYFHSTSNKVWDETPFEFDEAVKTEFAQLPDLPFVRRKDKVEKFVIPTGPKVNQTHAKTPEKPSRLKVDKAKEHGPRQPDFKLDHKIHFSDLEKIVFRQPKLSKLDVLQYYNKISAFILPYLKDRMVTAQVQRHNFLVPVRLTKSALFRDEEDTPEWLQVAKVNGVNDILISNDREHLLQAVERGALQFDTVTSKARQAENPDLLIIGIDSPESEITKAVDAALVFKTIADGLRLPAFIKTDGVAGFHVYLPLDAKLSYDESVTIAEYLCKLMRLKVPDMVNLVNSDDNTYGKVSLDASLNTPDKFVVAPYSLVATSTATVAAPLRWEELTHDLKLTDIDHESIFKRLKTDDPFENLYKKRINGKELLERLKLNYSFLF